MFLLPGAMWAQNACDLNRSGAVDVVDVQLSVNMMLGLIPCTANVNGSGVCDRAVVDRIVSVALGGTCGRTVSLSWAASTSANVTGYNIYRASTAGGPYTKVNSALVAGVSYTDSGIQIGQTYYYVARAVDSNNNESVNSNEAIAVVPTS